MVIWGVAPGQLWVDSVVVRCGGFTTLDPNTVAVSGRDWPRMTPLTVAPDMAKDSANAVLELTSESNNIASLRDLLADSGPQIPGYGAAAERFAAEQHRGVDDSRVCEIM